MIRTNCARCDSQSLRADAGWSGVVAHLLTSALGAGLIRAALASPFVASGLLKLLDREAAVAEFTALGLWSPALLVMAVIVTQLIGSLLLLSGRGAWLGAGILALFTALATVIAHPFWRFVGADQLRQLTIFLEHAALIGGLAAAAALRPRRPDEVTSSEQSRPGS
jgi:uncharacterized membrane protein YphA (DoxX/SURF4 family)